MEITLVTWSFKDPETTNAATFYRDLPFFVTVGADNQESRNFTIASTEQSVPHVINLEIGDNDFVQAVGIPDSWDGFACITWLTLHQQRLFVIHKDPIPVEQLLQQKDTCNDSDTMFINFNSLTTDGTLLPEN